MCRGELVCKIIVHACQTQEESLCIIKAWHIRSIFYSTRCPNGMELFNYCATIDIVNGAVYNSVRFRKSYAGTDPEGVDGGGGYSHAPTMSLTASY